MSRERGVFFMRSWFVLAAILALGALAYTPGLHGPFLFDDTPNIIQPIGAWLAGRTGWEQIVFGNASGLFHRPISNATFLANAAISGLAVLPFKLTNLAIHLICGALVYALLSRLLKRDANLRTRAKPAALLVCALWLLHPMQVSTVLYVVQRMAQLSTLFMLVGLIVYVNGRLALLAGRTRIGAFQLLVAVPAVTLAATLSKENGALLPLLCAIIELGYFRPEAGLRRPAVIKWFYLAFLLFPAIAAAYWFGIRHPIAESYSGRLFTLGERLLTEARVLVDYMGALLWPRGPMLGVYTDDFTVSRSLLDPPTTLLALLALATLIAAAWWWRKRIPVFFTGMGLYLAGQAMESTIFPLQIYFEHRNYLPSFGFFLAAVGFGTWLFDRATVHTTEPRRAQRVITLGCGLLILALSGATAARSYVWSSMDTIAEQGAHEHPQSMRAQLDYANSLRLQGRIKDTAAVFDHMMRMRNPAARHVGIIDSVALQCIAHQATDEQAVARISTIAGADLQLAEMLAFENLSKYLAKHECNGLTKVQLADLIVEVVNAAPQPQSLTQIWRSRFNAAELYLLAGEPQKAETQAALAWMPGTADTSVGVYLANLYRVNGDDKSARVILKDIEQRVAPWDERNLKLIGELDQVLGEGTTGRDK